MEDIFIFNVITENGDGGAFQICIIRISQGDSVINDGWRPVFRVILNRAACNFGCIVYGFDIHCAGCGSAVNIAVIDLECDCSGKYRRAVVDILICYASEGGLIVGKCVRSCKSENSG